MPSPRVGRGPATDFTVLSSLVGGLLIWLVLASYALGRSQRLAVRHLQEGAATYVATELNSATSAAEARALLSGNGALSQLAERMGIALTTADDDARPALAALSDVPGVRLVQATETPGMSMAPGRPELLQGFVVLALAATCGLGAVLLFRLQRQHEATSARTNFVRVVSHELRTPLTQILMFAETLRLGRTRHEGDRTFALDVILQETRRLSRLVENVLRFTGLEHGSISLQQEPVDVTELARETAAQFAGTPGHGGPEIVVHGDSGCDVFGDRDALRQVLLNLLDNAIKHGGANTAITVAVERTDTQVEMHVTDGGAGVAAEDRERIWHAFERGSSSRRSDAGTGLGLTIVRALTEAMAGTVRLHTPTSTDDARRGARFVVALPARRPLENGTLAPVGEREFSAL